jgi:hypothetical protein
VSLLGIMIQKHTKAIMRKAVFNFIVYFCSVVIVS